MRTDFVRLSVFFVNPLQVRRRGDLDTLPGLWNRSAQRCWKLAHTWVFLRPNVNEYVSDGMDGHTRIKRDGRVEGFCVQPPATFRRRGRPSSAIAV